MEPFRKRNELGLGRRRIGFLGRRDKGRWKVNGQKISPYLSKEKGKMELDG